MKNIFILYYPIYGVVAISLLIFLPIFIKDIILDLFGLKDLTNYYEVVGAITSGIALIITIISLKNQQKEINKQNSRLDNSIRVEGLTKALEIRKMFAQANPDLREDKEWIRKTADYLRDLESSVDKMIEETKKSS